MWIFEVDLLLKYLTTDKMLNDKKNKYKWGEYKWHVSIFIIMTCME